MWEWSRIEVNQEEVKETNRKNGEEMEEGKGKWRMMLETERTESLWDENGMGHGWKRRYYVILWLKWMVKRE